MIPEIIKFIILKGKKTRKNHCEYYFVILFKIYQNLLIFTYLNFISIFK
jgi:hypothetical protein